MKRSRSKGAGVSADNHCREKIVSDSGAKHIRRRRRRVSDNFAQVEAHIVDWARQIDATGEVVLNLQMVLDEARRMDPSFYLPDSGDCASAEEHERSRNAANTWWYLLRKKHSLGLFSGMKPAETVVVEKTTSPTKRSARTKRKKAKKRGTPANCVTSPQKRSRFEDNRDNFSDEGDVFSTQRSEEEYTKALAPDSGKIGISSNGATPGSLEHNNCYREVIAAVASAMSSRSYEGSKESAKRSEAPVGLDITSISNEKKTLWQQRQQDEKALNAKREANEQLDEFYHTDEGLANTEDCSEDSDGEEVATAAAIVRLERILIQIAAKHFREGLF